MMESTKNPNHPITNAIAHIESIHALEQDAQRAENGDLDKSEARAIYARHDREGLRFNETEVQEMLEGVAAEMPLSVLVRGGWHTPGEPRAEQPAEYEILLTTGGPGLRIIGELNQHCEPIDAHMQWQDWGTPWTDLHMGDVPDALGTPSQVDDLVLMFASHFYYGGG
jgi:hypothetical protein